MIGCAHELRYVFRPSLFHAERAITLDDSAIMVVEGDRAPRRLPWDRILEVHLEPATAGDDDRTRWLINLRASGGEKIQIDSVNVRGTADFEHKTEEFLAVLGAIHKALAAYPGVRYLIGSRRGFSSPGGLRSSCSPQPDCLPPAPRFSSATSNRCSSRSP